MLVVAEPGRVAEVQAVCAKWELGATPIGHVTDDGVFRVTHDGLTVVAIPGQRLVDDAPVYHPEAREAPAAVARRSAAPPPRAGANIEADLRALLDTPSIASKRWVYEQYDSTVQASTAQSPGSDAGVAQVPGTTFGIAVTVDCNSRLVALDPYEGGKATVAEAARNIACSGAVPLGITDCLNFGNPEKPEVFFQFREACRGISDACVAFGTPVTGGNVSFYNENPNGAIDPTPTVGMVGFLESLDNRVSSFFRNMGDAIIVLGNTAGVLGGSALWAELDKFVGGAPAPVDLDAERRLQEFLVAAARERLLRSAHDCSEGGLAVTLAECAIGGPYAAAGIGAAVDLTAHAGSLDPHRLLFGEDHGRAVVTCSRGHSDRVLALAATHGVPAALVGSVGERHGPLAIRAGGLAWQWPVDELRRIFFDAIPRRLQQVTTDAALEG
jgi:phosphoribosylformylglycinamidine synthase